MSELLNIAITVALVYYVTMTEFERKALEDAVKNIYDWNNAANYLNYEVSNNITLRHGYCHGRSQAN
jgi:hypothetical protein